MSDTIKPYVARYTLSTGICMSEEGLRLDVSARYSCVLPARSKAHARRILRQMAPEAKSVKIEETDE